jgi:cobyrinic acid a,c-diamide synthase
VPALEQEDIKEDIERLGLALEASLNLEEILKIARRAGPLPKPLETVFPFKAPAFKVPIGLAWDKAFNFYYQDGLDYLSALGVEWVPFSPLKEEKLPEGIAGLVIGCGFPEIFLPELSSNKRMLRLVSQAAAQGLPLYAECGGLMYLSRGLRDHNGRYWSLAGVIPALCRMEGRLAGMGYRQARALRHTLYTRPGERVRGHEFHYSRLQPLQTFFPWAYSWSGTANNVLDGYAFHNILASYLHLHWVGNPKLAQRFVEACRRYQKKKLI